MQARWLRTAAAWSVLVLQSAVVRGADGVSAEADAAAQQAYQRAEAAYRAKDLPSALQEMQQAYQLSQRADLLYNLARIEDELGQCTAARAHYRQYLDRVPQGEARKDAQVADERLAGRCAEEAAATAAPVAAPAAAAPLVALPPPQAPQTLPRESSADGGTAQRWVGWSLVAGGVVAGLGAAYFWDAGLDSRSAYQASVDREEQGGPHRDESLDVDKNRHERRAQVLGASSAALLVGGALLVLLAPKAQPAVQSAGLQLQPGLFVATYKQTF